MTSTQTPSPARSVLIGAELAARLAELIGPTVDASWEAQALCPQTDPEAFFPEKGGSTLPAKQICRRCPVRAQCLQTALERKERYGIWGGLSDTERRRMMRADDDDRRLAG